MNGHGDKIDQHSPASTGKAAFTIKEFCSAYGVCRSFVYREIKAGSIQIKKAGSRTLILRRDAEAWAEALPAGNTH